MPHSATQSRAAPRTEGQRATGRGHAQPRASKPNRRSAAGARARGGNNSPVCEIEVIDRVKVERARQALPPSERLETLAETLRALGDPTRLLIVTALATEELCVCDIAMLVGVSRSAVSHSLRTLRQLRLVRYRKVGKIAYYSLDDGHVADLVRDGLQHVEEHG